MNYYTHGKTVVVTKCISMEAYKLLKSLGYTIKFLS